MTDRFRKEPGRARRYFLPGSATGHRETIITSLLNAEPEYLRITPGLSAWPARLGAPVAALSFVAVAWQGLPALLS